MGTEPWKASKGVLPWGAEVEERFFRYLLRRVPFLLSFPLCLPWVIFLFFGRAMSGGEAFAGLATCRDGSHPATRAGPTAGGKYTPTGSHTKREVMGNSY